VVTWDVGDFGSVQDCRRILPAYCSNIKSRLNNRCRLCFSRVGVAAYLSAVFVCLPSSPWPESRPSFASRNVFSTSLHSNSVSITRLEKALKAEVITMSSDSGCKSIPESIHESIADFSSDYKASTIGMNFTPHTTVKNEDHDSLEYGYDKPKTPSSSVPWPGSTFIIRCVSTGEVITLLKGEVVMARPGGPGSIHWVCEETKGWLGFRNPVSGKTLGHSHGEMLCCVQDHHRSCEYFCARMSPEGGYVLLMTDWKDSWTMWYLTVVEEGGTRKLTKTEKGSQDATVWEFIKV
jgi:hypothetical protein